MFDFDTSGQDDQLAYWRGLLEIDAVVDRDPRLQMRDIDERSAQIFAKPLEFARALPSGARRPALQAQKNNNDHDRNDECDQCEGHWPGEATRS